MTPEAVQRAVEVNGWQAQHGQPARQTEPDERQRGGVAPLVAVGPTDPDPGHGRAWPLRDDRDTARGEKRHGTAGTAANGD
jgi:hypothetical protein